MARFYKVGSGAAAVGAIHILTLLLSWYSETDHGFSTPIAGYVFIESFMLSVIGGLLAGIGLLIGYLLKRVKAVKLAIGVLAVIGGLMALGSPIYIYINKISALGIKGYPDLGFFAAIFTGVAQLGVGSLALLTPVKEEIISAPEAPTPMVPTPTAPRPQVRPPSPRAAPTTKLTPAVDLEEAVCSICYEAIAPGDAIRCSNCDAIFHKGCIDAWVSLNGTCPSCKAVVVD